MKYYYLEVLLYALKICATIKYSLNKTIWFKNIFICLVHLKIRFMNTPFWSVRSKLCSSTSAKTMRTFSQSHIKFLKLIR